MPACSHLRGWLRIVRMGRCARGTKAPRLPGTPARWSRRALTLPWRLAMVVVLVCFWAASAQTGWGQHFTFAQFGQADGLLNKNVSSIVQDKSGVLWVGTENGLYLADGNRFTKVEAFLNSQHGSVYALHVDGAGRVWVIGSNRLVYFDEDRQLHLIENLDLSEFSARQLAITSLPDDKNTVYLMLNSRLVLLKSADGGLNWERSPVYGEEVTRSHPAITQVISLAADLRRHSLWAGCAEALCELHIPRAGSAHAIPAPDIWDTSRGIPPNRWRAVLPASDGRIWARGEREVIALDPGSWAVVRAGDALSPGETDPRILTLTEDLDGSILLNLPHGLARWRNNGWTRLSPANGLPPNRINATYFDPRGGVWLAPSGQGLWRWLGYGTWQHWTESEGLGGNEIWGLLRTHQKQLWVLSSTKLNRMNTAGEWPAWQDSGITVPRGRAMAEDLRGHLWIITGDGILLDYDPRSRQAREVAGHLGFLYSVLATKASLRHPQRVWIGLGDGVGYVSEEDGWKALHRVTDPAAPASSVWSIAEDASGMVWFSSLKGLFRFSENRWTRISLDTQISTAQTPSIAPAPDGTLWIQAGIPTPLLHLKVTGDHAEVIGAVGSEMIGTDDIAFIKVDQRGWLWVGTDQGVYVSNGRRWVHTTEEDGLISDDSDTGSVLEDDDGSMWIGTTGGVSHLLHPQSLFEIPVPEINVRVIRVGGTGLEVGSNPRLNVRKPTLFVEMFTNYYKRPRAVLFQYRLLGREENWQTTASGRIEMSGLPPGDYRLQLQALDQRAHQSSRLVEYSFTVLPPWYKRDSPRIAAALLLVLLATLCWKVSVRRLQNSEATLKAKVDRQTAQLLAEKEQLERAQLELVEISRRDALTGLLNRSAIFDALARMRRFAMDRGGTLTVIMADLDHFKSINDRYGHTVGDAVLRECAERFREVMRPGDAVGRYGGEELLIAIPGLSREHAISRVEEIRTAIAMRPVVYGTHSLQVTCSFGVGWLSEEHSDLESMINAADAALYVAKQNGRNRVEFTPESMVSAVRSMRL